MSAKQLGLPGRFARLYNNERFVDVTVLLATPESLQTFKASQQPTTVKQAVLDALASSQQPSEATTVHGSDIISNPHAAHLDEKVQDTAAGATQQVHAQLEEGQEQQALGKRESTGWVDVEELEQGQSQQPKTPAAQQKEPHLLRLPAETGSQALDVNKRSHEPEGSKVKATKSVLAAASEYFYKRLEDWSEDPWTMTGGDGKPLLVVGVEEGLHKAAAAVVRVMYEEVVPDGTPALQLAQMCKVADMWDAQECLRLSFSNLTQLKASELDLQGTPAIWQVLPDAVQKLSGHSTWVQQCAQMVCEGVSAGKDVQPLLLQVFGDVHAMLTSPQLLQHFRQLPLQAARIWADSDNLVVDSEDSVAVALGWWVAGEVGSMCSEDQLKELSGLLRVRHMSTGFRLGSLGELGWFKFSGTAVLHHMNVAIPSGVLKGCSGIPPGWLQPPRKQLPLTELERRCTITWDVPEAALQLLLTADTLGSLTSGTVYMAGTGVQLLLQSEKEEGGKMSCGVYLQLADYAQHGFTLCSAGLSCSFTTSRKVPGQEQMSVVLSESATLASRYGWGLRNVITASTPADLEPYLVDGYLRLKATIRLIPG